MWECQPQMRKKVKACRHFLARPLCVFSAFCHLDASHPVERGCPAATSENLPMHGWLWDTHRPRRLESRPGGNGGSQICSILLLHSAGISCIMGRAARGREMDPSTANLCVRRRIEPERNLLLEPMRAQNFIARGNGPVGPSEHMLHRYLYKTT